jgi:hypothetical protein
MASDYDDLRAQCGGMEMEIQELRQDLANLREGGNRLVAHKDAGLTKADIDIATLECDNEALQAELRRICPECRRIAESRCGHVTANDGDSEHG